MRAVPLAVLCIGVGLLFVISPAAAAQPAVVALGPPPSSGNWHVEFYANGAQIYPQYVVSVVLVNSTGLPVNDAQVWARSNTSYPKVLAQIGGQDWQSLAGFIHVPGGDSGAAMYWRLSSVGPSWTMASQRFVADPNLISGPSASGVSPAATSCSAHTVCGNVYGWHEPSGALYGMFSNLVLISLVSNPSDPYWQLGAAYTDPTGYYSIYVNQPSETLYEFTWFHGIYNCGGGMCNFVQPLIYSVSFTWPGGSGSVVYNPVTYDYNQTSEAPVLRAWDTGTSYIQTQVEAQSSSTSSFQASKQLAAGGSFQYGSVSFGVSSDWGYTTNSMTQIGPYTYAESQEITFLYQYQDYFQDTGANKYSALWCNQCNGIWEMQQLALSGSDPVSESNAAIQYGLYNYQSGPTKFYYGGTINNNIPPPSPSTPYQLPLLYINNGQSKSTSWQFSIGIPPLVTFTYGETTSSTNNVGFMVGAQVYQPLPSGNNLFAWMPTIARGNTLDYHVYEGLFDQPYFNNFETSPGWTPSASGGSSFVAHALNGYSTTVSKSPTHSVRVGFTGGNADGTDYGSVINYYDYATTRINEIRIAYYDNQWSHDGGSWDSLNAGIRMRLYNSAGTNYATYEYWLASWYHGQNCETPPSGNDLSISCHPSMNTWLVLDRYPNSDWSISWSGCVKVRIEVFASAAGTYGDQFLMYFDDFAMG